MKKIILGLLLLCMTTPAWAVPFRSGIYLGLKGGGAYTKFSAPWTENAKSEDKSDVSLAMAAAVGVRIRHFRLEAEYMMANKQKAAGNYEQTMDTIMAQGYFDLPFKSAIRPFVNLGAGVYIVDFKKKNEWSDNAKEFTWSVGGGLSWAVSTATNLDIGYRYYDVGKLKTRDGSLDQDNHVLYFGWRHVF